MRAGPAVRLSFDGERGSRESGAGSQRPDLRRQHLEPVPELVEVRRALVPSKKSETPIEEVRRAEVPEVEVRRANGVSSETFQTFQAYHDATMPEVERRLGTLRARRIQLGNHSIFPNGILGLRLALPRGPLRTEFWHFVLVDRDAPDRVSTILEYCARVWNRKAVSGPDYCQDYEHVRSVAYSRDSSYTVCTMDG